MSSLPNLLAEVVWSHEKFLIEPSKKLSLSSFVLSGPLQQVPGNSLLFLPLKVIEMAEFHIYMVLLTFLKFLPLKPHFFLLTGGKTEAHINEDKEHQFLAPSNDNNKEALIGSWVLGSLFSTSHTPSRLLSPTTLYKGTMMIPFFQVRKLREDSVRCCCNKAV